MDLVRALSSLFSEVLRAVEQLREVTSNRETRTFARRVASEKIVYDQFARRLALLSPLPSASQGLMVDVEDKIGPSAVLDLQRDLGHMNESLLLLKADIFNASRGTVSTTIPYIRHERMADPPCRKFSQSLAAGPRLSRVLHLRARSRRA